MIERRGDELDNYIFTCPICLEECSILHDEKDGKYAIRYRASYIDYGKYLTIVYDTSLPRWTVVISFDKHIALDAERIKKLLLLQ